jgi:hypothetical protein
MTYITDIKTVAALGSGWLPPTRAQGLAGGDAGLGERPVSALEHYHDDYPLAALDAVRVTKAKHGMAFSK